MKRLLLNAVAVLICFITYSQDVANITSAEYFIDNDPGVGNGTSISIGASGSTVNFVASIPTTSLTPGFHNVFIRTKDADAKWGLFESRGFYISTATADVTNIISAEYFIDNDPGVGNGTSLNIGASGSTVNFVASIPTTSLTPGFHSLFIRTKDADGKWGLFESRGFYLSTATADVANIISAEYFIDNDPGVGNGTSLNIGASGSTVNFNAAIPTASLASGFHSLFIRVKGADGIWGLFESRGFYISTATTEVTNIISAEYFIDADPGVGNGVVLTINTPGSSINQSFVVPVPAGSTNGDHFLFIRVKDMDGKWGLFERDTFTVSSAVPLNLLSFNGFKQNDKVALIWKTANEINTSHFIIEKSNNGISFQSLGTVNAKGNAGENNYNFTDGVPYSGLNFYRLKQIDKDGKLVYSNIIRILFNAAADIVIYPNPVKEKITISLPATGEKWITNLYSSNGKLVNTFIITASQNIQIPVQYLSKGNYVLQLSNGVIKHTARFIKE